MTRITSNLIAAMAAAALFAGCSHGGDASTPEGAVAKAGNEYLMRSELRRHLRAGMTPDDSTTLAKAYIRSWIDARLIATVAASEVDMDEIDRLTDE